MQAIACIRAHDCFSGFLGSRSGEEEDLVLMWGCSHRVDHNKTVEVWGVWWMWKFLRPVRVDWRTPRTASSTERVG